MNPRAQLFVSAGLVGAALGAVALYGLASSPADAAAVAPAHDHAAMAAAGASGDGRPVRLDAEQARRIGVTYATARVRPLARAVQTVGTVAWDETRLATVNPKIEGWIERLYVDFTGAPVTRGQPLMEVYSPMLVAAQEELVLARRLADEQRAAGAVAGGVDAQELLAAARRRLRGLDVGDGEIAAVERGGAPRRTVTLRAPASGVVVEKTAVRGMRIMPGMDLYRIADLSSVWVDGEVFEKDLSQVRTGQRATVAFEAYPGERFDAVVSYVYPTVSMEARTGRVRLALPNPGGRLKPGMYARIELQGPAPRDALVIPRSAVHATGERALVFVRGADGALVPRQVTLGAASGSDVEVLAGLAAGEVVVASANFLIDAESNMGAAMGSMPGMEMGGAPASPSPAPSTPPAPRPSASMQGMDGMKEMEGMPGMPSTSGAATPHAGHRK